MKSKVHKKLINGEILIQHGPSDLEAYYIWMRSIHPPRDHAIGIDLLINKMEKFLLLFLFHQSAQQSDLVIVLNDGSFLISQLYDNIHAHHIHIQSADQNGQSDVIEWNEIDSRRGKLIAVHTQLINNSYCVSDLKKYFHFYLNLG